ncbi:MAG: hypothetical protein PHI79_04585 [Sulfurovaceae bacterium]|nr:hypothetical protein [Sulfurovaceae bacterium]MDD5548861.1 hypothetical protein [Sulfurovaceae bacterium]
MKKSKCTYKRKRFDDIESHFECTGEGRVSIRTIVKTKQKIDAEAIEFLIYLSKMNDISLSSAMEKIIKDSILYGIDYTAIVKNQNKKHKLPKLTIHPAYIEILQILRNSNSISWARAFEYFILNYKKKFNFC